MDGAVVFGYGPQPADVLIVGQNPGRVEAREGKPFCGPSGAEQRAYLRRAAVNVDDCYVTNVSKEYNAKDAPPTDEQIATWTPLLEAEVVVTQPRVIAAVGAYATRFFLGDDADFTACQGLPHRPGEFDDTIAYRACSAVVVPVLHPAAAMRDDKGDKRALCARDYQAVGDTLRAVLAGETITYRHDEYACREHYVDATGADIKRLLDDYIGDLAIDTEGDVDDPISVQVCIEPGTGYMLWYGCDDFVVGAAAIQAAVDRGCCIVTHDASTPHRCMHDTVVCRAMGIELSHASSTFNTMLALYEMRLESWGLKAAGWRWCGVRMNDYMGLVAGLARERQLQHLDRISNYKVPLPFDTTPAYTKSGKLAKRQPQPKFATWPTIEPTIELCNDGTLKVVSVQRPNTTAARLARDVRAGKVDNQGRPVSIEKRYGKWKAAARAQVEAVYGKLPTATLRDVDRADATRYGCADADVTLRVCRRLRVELARLDLDRTIAISGAVLPIYESAQRTGLPASRRKFVALHEHLTREAASVQARISHEYWNDEPFNPKSPKHVAALMKARGLKGAKRTKTGAVSTGKKSVEHFRFKGARNYDPAMALVTDWREYKHTDNMYCVPVLRNKLSRVATNGHDADSIIINPNWKPMGAVTGRPSVDNPPLLAFPKHEKPSGINYGQMLRNCFVCPPGTTFIEIDLSQIELRMFAHASEDPVMCDAFVKGYADPDGEHDLHTATAARIFGVPYREVTKLQRFLAKSTNFGTLFGISAYGLVDQQRQRGIFLSERECEGWRIAWRQLYSRGWQFIGEVERETERCGYVRDWSGHYRFLAGVLSPDEKVRAEARRQAVNVITQGGAGAYMKCAMAWMWPTIQQWKRDGEFIDLALMVYDSLVFWCDERHADKVEALAVEALEHHGGLTLRVPVRAESSRATSWGQL